MQVNQLFPRVGLFVNERFAEQYEQAEVKDDYVIYRGFAKTSRMSLAVRRSIAYRDGPIQLCYGFRPDGIYLCFTVTEFRKDIFLRAWSEDEVRMWELYEEVEKAIGPFIVNIHDRRIRYYPANDWYSSPSLEFSPHDIFYDVVRTLTCPEIAQICQSIHQCWLTQLIDRVLLERGLAFDYSGLE